MIVAAAISDGVFVSPVYAWEIGLLCVAGRFLHAKTPQAAQQWIAKLLARVGIQRADRFLLATARCMNVPLVTRGRMMLQYAEAGHVECILC